MGSSEMMLEKISYLRNRLTEVKEAATTAQDSLTKLADSALERAERAEKKVTALQGELKRFAKIIGDGSRKLTEVGKRADAAQQVLATRWEHRCSDKVGGCTAVSLSALTEYDQSAKKGTTTCSGGSGAEGKSMCKTQHPDEPSVWCDACRKGSMKGESCESQYKDGLEQIAWGDCEEDEAADPNELCSDDPQLMCNRCRAKHALAD